MKRVKGISIIAIGLLILQLFANTMGLFAAAEQMQSPQIDPGKLLINDATHDEDTITWSIVVNEGQMDVAEMIAIIASDEGQSHQEIKGLDDDAVKEIANGYEIVTPEGSESHTITVTTAIMDDEQTEFSLTAEGEIDGEIVTAEETVIVENEVSEVPGEEQETVEDEEQDTEGDANEETNIEAESDAKKNNNGEHPEIQEINEHTPGILPNIAPRILSSSGGDVDVDKKATPTGNFLEWDVELEVSGEDIIQETYDIVLVFDRSNSMNEGNREASSKAAAKQFADNLLDRNNTNIKIGVVPFGSNTSGNSAAGRIELTDDAEEVKDAINSIIIGPSYQDGGTHISAGL